MASEDSPTDLLPQDSENGSHHDGGGADRARKGRWKRAAQVCTNCRQMKLRCDFQERFPEPCTRCAAAGGSARGMPCHVDPAFKRVTKRNPSDAAAPAPASNDNVDPSEGHAPFGPTELPFRIDSGQLPFTRLAPSPASDASGASPASGSTSSNARPVPRTLGTVILTGDEIAGLFDEFYTHYHPLFPLFLDPGGPDETYDRCTHVFWAICTTGARPRSNHPVPRARTYALCGALNIELRAHIADLLVSREKAGYRAVQALLLLCEFGHHVGRDDSAWIYSGMAVTMGLQLGMHRPRFASEYATLDDPDRAIQREEIRERVLTWIQCFNVHQSIASFKGFPGQMADDWVLIKASTKPLDYLCEKVLPLPDVFRLVRIQRLARRLNMAVGNDPYTPSGQAPPAARAALLQVFGAELADLEASLAASIYSAGTHPPPPWTVAEGPYREPPAPDPKFTEGSTAACANADTPSPLAPVVAARLLDAKLQLYAFELQDDGAARPGTGDRAEGGGAPPEDLLVCYTAAVRLLGVCRAMAASPATRPSFWPRTLFASFTAGILCLLKLAGLQALAPRRLPLDRGVLLRELGSALGVLRARSLTPGDGDERRAQGIGFICAQLRDGAPAISGITPGGSARSRMSLGGLLYDGVRQIRAYKAQREKDAADAAARAKTALETAARAAANAASAPQFEELAQLQAAHAAGVSAAASAPVLVPAPAPAPAPVPAPYAVPDNQTPVPTWEAGFDMSQVPQGLGTLPAFDSPEWLQLLSAESCAELMAFPGFGGPTAWEIPDFMMADPMPLQNGF